MGKIDEFILKFLNSIKINRLFSAILGYINIHFTVWLVAKQIITFGIIMVILNIISTVLIMKAAVSNK